MDSHKLTWAASLDDGQERWQRTDNKVFDFCQDPNKIYQLVSTSISNLEEAASYTFSLVAMNDSFTKSSATIVMFTSGMYALINDLHNIAILLYLAPSGPPIYFRGHPANPSAMVISWDEPRLLDRNGQITNYVITLRNTSDEESFVIAANRCNASRSTNTGGCSSGRHSKTLTDLAPNVIFDVRVAAINSNGTGPMSNSILLSSGEDSEFIIVVIMLSKL